MVQPSELVLEGGQAEGHGQSGDRGRGEIRHDGYKIGFLLGYLSGEEVASSLENHCAGSL